jgi:two-component system CheB/CheR fusion protein
MRLIAVTGYGLDADRLRSVEAGMDVHLVKPVDLDALEAAVRAVTSISM